MTAEYLHPLSYHLRAFGQYQSLDLDASKMGNITFLGANAVGKTTLANCWFPMLIDGSIATPSFNPARSTEAISQSANPRNTPRDQHTFSSMLLGWGQGAYQTRTGYTYVVLGSSSRKLVLGIGAHRQSDGVRSQTWWFVLEDANAETLVCVDEKGNGLERDDFADANAKFGEQLHVFKRWEEYRSFVAVNVYGFDSGDTLGKLANAYRLLASPILTSGGARFAPIPKALSEAQEPIDFDQIIRPLAESKRSLNRTLALQEQLESGQKRLEKIQTALFWGNLNQLAGGLLPAHTRQITRRDQAQNAAAAAKAAVLRLQGQLDLIETQQKSADTVLQNLRQQWAAQQQQEKMRQYLDQEIAHLNQQQAIYTKQQRDLKQFQEELAALQAKLTALNAARQALTKQQLEPLNAKLHAQSANMQVLTEAIAQTEQAKVLAQLAAYLETEQRQLKEYQHLAEAIARTSKDAALVQGMQGQMDTAIDKHAGGVLFKSANQSLHQANRQIHETGTAAMNQAAAALQKKQQALLAADADLSALLENPEKLAKLGELSKALQNFAEKLAENKKQADLLTVKLAGKQAQIAQVQAAIDPDFQAAQAAAQIAELTRQRNALHIDPDLEKKQAAQKEALLKLQATNSDLTNKRGKQQGIAGTQTQNAADAQDELGAIDAQLTDALAVLQVYAPKETELTAITAALTFVHQNKPKIDRNPAAALGDKVRTQIDGQNGAQSLGDLFAARGADDLAAALRDQRTEEKAGLLVVPFDLQAAETLIAADIAAVSKAAAERSSGQSLALSTYLSAAVFSISQQYAVVPQYNAMLTKGADPDGIRLHVRLQPLPGSTQQAVSEAKDLKAQSRPALKKFVEGRIDHLAADTELANDDEAFMDKAQQLLDTRFWSEFVITINRRHSDVEEVVNDSFVQSGGSGAEKAQAMVLPLLLVPKMRLQQAAKPDALHLVMFDEFADKLDPETARAFAQTIARFGFNFIATMPTGGQVKILADGVANRAYEVLAPRRKDGRFHANQVHEVLTWQEAPANE